MKKTILFFLIAFVSTLTKAQPSETSLLWEITGNGLQKPSYLFGTIHMICKEDFIMTDVIRETFNKADQVFLELDMDDPALQMNMMKHMQLEKGTTLKSIFGEEGYAKLDSFFKAKLGMSVALFNGFKPFLVMSMMYQKALNCSEQESYEMAFVKMATANKKDIKGLETMEDQIAVFDSIPDQEEATSILKMVADFGKQQNEFEKMIALYKAQNIQGLYEYSVASPDLMGAEEILLNNRNQKWIPIMKENMSKGSCFFAVGAAHLGGSPGVINLLRQSGYSVKAVKL